MGWVRYGQGHEGVSWVGQGVGKAMRMCHGLGKAMRVCHGLCASWRGEGGGGAASQVQEPCPWRLGSRKSLRGGCNMLRIVARCEAGPGLGAGRAGPGLGGWAGPGGRGG